MSTLAVVAASNLEIDPVNPQVHVVGELLGLSDHPRDGAPLHVTEPRAIHNFSNGYTHDYPVERRHSDAKIFTIFAGTSEIQRLVISRALTGLPIR